MTRRPLTTDRVVATSRELLVEGGPDAVVVREVARRLGVTAPALYRHVDGREGLLTSLIAACQDEVADVCQAAVDGCDLSDHDGRLRAAVWAFRTWATTNPPEFGLIYGTPISGYQAPEGGPTAVSGRRFGELFGMLFVDLLRAGRLRTLAEVDLDPSLRTDLQHAAASLGMPVRAGELYPFVAGFQRMLGIVSVDVSGHLRWAFEDTEAFTRRQLEALMADLLHPVPTPAR